MKLPREIILEREKKVWMLRQKLRTQEGIAKELGVTQSAVSQILRRLHKRFSEANRIHIEQVKVEQVLQLEYIAFEAMQAWERSKQFSIKKNNARYLLVAMKAKEAIRKVLGVGMFANLENEEFTKYQNLSDQELRDKVMEALR